MKFNKKETIDYEKILDSIGFKELNSFDKKNMIMILKYIILDCFYKDYPNNVQKSPLFGMETIYIYLLMEIFKYQLETSTKCDKLIEQNSEVINQNNQLLEQNNQIIELLQKIADK